MTFSDISSGGYPTPSDSEITGEAIIVDTIIFRKALQIPAASDNHSRFLPSEWVWL